MLSFSLEKKTRPHRALHENRKKVGAICQGWQITETEWTTFCCVCHTTVLEGLEVAVENMS